MLHLNLPAPTDDSWMIFWRKARWVLLGVLAPEVLMLIACGQWSSAHRSVLQMRGMGFDKTQWSLTHAFFADSGGIVFQLQHGDYIPLSAKQLAWLIAQGYTKLPEIKEKDISDKSKAGMCTKALAFCQTTWFLVRLIARAIENLPVTPLELASAALALTSLTTLSFWVRKPMDVQQPFIIKASRSSLTVTESELDGFSDICVNVATLEEVEPRVYISRKWSRRVLAFICQMGFQKQCMDRIPNDRDPQLLGFCQHATLGITTAAFAFIHFADWHFDFATDAEVIIWRINCCIMWVLLATYGTAEVIICSREKYQNLGLDTAGGYKLKWPTCLWFFIPAITYFCARLVLIVGVFVNLRSLPERAYLEVQWPDIGYL
ncbi:uncharacterized protein N7483_004523 [Penicillium malachiteum]|uniref:uncharacterized protein n=1 Tax=Penicillium malachiteum TaxID=1324776 RepID=UPI0025477315|nr:uncharacterized protein N7483_004523 [Penicillium malachiteum]KAJ5730015.1 hypothetical protein N7483_004523 [Penicillium malachiteum]